ncbi:GAF domain-containing sensor histidine kinase [Shewanella pealeana]|uniref:Histidine kinase n=1 Tax=Shewanella pealeana (strain ATCC 700345 / ANG-SQ1) TaxID=398579 RepID=A8H3C0_SHEPA|nr:GAF domain-containing sensor histidine kinase [Shewanella pealeana]ABV87057.1 histidine kinase [Shewanella pealeana ATCC 700345]
MKNQDDYDFAQFNQTLLSISTQLLDTPTSSLAEVMNSVLDECRELLGVDRISCLPNTKYIAQEWSFYAVSGKNIPHVRPNLSYEIKARYQAMIHSSEVFNSDDDLQLLELACQLQQQKPLNHILIPIQAMGKPWGALAAANFVTHKAFDEHFIRCSTILGNIMASSIERLRHYQELSHQKEKVVALNKRLIEDREKQLKVIARDLHDDFGQRLASLNLELGFINTQLDNESQKALYDVAAKLSDITRDLQHLSRHLHPAIIDKVGLYAAIEAEAKKMTLHKNILLSLNLSKEILYSEGQKLHIYRISQEALANVMRHSHATALSICLNREGKFAKLTIEDNGKGMAQDALANSSSLGIESMLERAALIGGTIDFTVGHHQCGFSVKLVWPIPEDMIN